ncbi:unnamed protein product, partial [Ascophyllum nodosum]
QSIVLLVHGGACALLLAFRRGKKRKHTLNKHRSPPIIPVEGALRMLQTHGTRRTLPFVLIQSISSCARSIPPMILLPPTLPTPRKYRRECTVASHPSVFGCCNFWTVAIILVPNVLCS